MVAPKGPKARTANSAPARLPGGFALPMAKALDNNAMLSSLLARLQQSRDCFDLIRPLITADLLPHVRAGPLTDSEWCVLAANGAVASKLRQLLPSFEAALRSQGRQVTSIRIRVQSPLLKP